MVRKYDITPLRPSQFISSPSKLLKRFFSVCLSQASEIIPEKDKTDPSSGNERKGNSKEVLTIPAVHLLAFFLFYYGAETTMGGTILVVVITTSFNTCVQCSLIMDLFFYIDRLDCVVHR
jgi:hypothetical protein